MGFNANLGGKVYQERKVISGRHQSVIETLELDNEDEHRFYGLFDLEMTKKLPAGAILSRVGDKVVAFDATIMDLSDIVGVLVEDADPTVNRLVTVLVHGIVIEKEVYYWAGDHIEAGVTPDIRRGLRAMGTYLD